MTRLIFLLLLLLPLVSAHSAAPDPLVDSAYLYDPSGKLDIGTASTATYKPFNKDLSLGFKSGAAWMRFVITPTPVTGSAASQTNSRNDQLVLRVGPYFLDKLELYELKNGQWSRQISGDLHPDHANVCIDDLHCFRLSGGPSGPFTIFLRVQNQGLLAVQTDVVGPESLIATIVKRIQQITISLTLAIGLFFLGLILFLKHRSLLLNIYCWFQASIIMFLVSTSGLHVHFLPKLEPALLDVIAHFSYLVRVMLTVLIGWAVLVPYQPSLAYKALIYSLVAGCLIEGGLIWTGHISLALPLIFLVFMLSPFFHIYGVIRAKGISVKIRNVLLLGYVTLILVSSMGYLIASGVIAPFQDAALLRQIADWRLNGMVFGLFIFWIVVTEQSLREKLKTGELITLRLEAAQAKANEERLQDRHTLIDILTHELKNPLGTIRFALASLKRTVTGDEDASRRYKHIDLCVSRMNALIEHVARSTKIDRFESFGEKEQIFAADLINELIDEYPEINRFDVTIQPEASFHTNREMLTVIFENLISNAYKYAHSGAKIKITIASEKSFTSLNPAVRIDRESKKQIMYFEISNAVGIYAAPEPSRLFERYYRHPNTQEMPGLGIGLSLVQAAAQKIGARVDYLGKEEFVVFTVEVPN